MPAILVVEAEPPIESTPARPKADVLRHHSVCD
jgi:hypothetical protein